MQITLVLSQHCIVIHENFHPRKKTKLQLSSVFSAARTEHCIFRGHLAALQVYATSPLFIFVFGFRRIVYFRPIQLITFVFKNINYVGQCVYVNRFTSYFTTFQRYYKRSTRTYLRKYVKDLSTMRLDNITTWFRLGSIFRWSKVKFFSYFFHTDLLEGEWLCSIRLIIKLSAWFEVIFAKW